VVAGASSSAMTSADNLSLILRRLDEIERKLDRMMEELRAPLPSAIRYGMAIFQRRTDCPKKQIFGVNEQIPGPKVSATRAFVQKMHSDIP
jgi:hypothetical protein